MYIYILSWKLWNQNKNEECHLILANCLEPQMEPPIFRSDSLEAGTQGCLVDWGHARWLKGMRGPRGHQRGCGLHGALKHEVPRVSSTWRWMVGLCVPMSPGTGSLPPHSHPSWTRWLGPAFWRRSSCELLAANATAAGGWEDLGRAPAVSLGVPAPGCQLEEVVNTFCDSQLMQSCCSGKIGDCLELDLFKVHSSLQPD